MRAVDGVQVAGGGQLGRELTPGHLEDLVGDVSLDYLDKVLHLVSVELQLTELHRATGAFHQRCGDKSKSWSLLMANGRSTVLYTVTGAILNSFSSQNNILSPLFRASCKNIGF